MGNPAHSDRFHTIIGKQFGLFFYNKFLADHIPGSSKGEQHNTNGTIFVSQTPKNEGFWVLTLLL